MPSEDRYWLRLGYRLGGDAEELADLAEDVRCVVEEDGLLVGVQLVVSRGHLRGSELEGVLQVEVFGRESDGFVGQREDGLLDAHHHAGHQRPVLVQDEQQLVVFGIELSETHAHVLLHVRQRLLLDLDFDPVLGVQQAFFEVVDLLFDEVQRVLEVQCDDRAFLQRRLVAFELEPVEFFVHDAVQFGDAQHVVVELVRFWVSWWYREERLGLPARGRGFGALILRGLSAER